MNRDQILAGITALWLGFILMGCATIVQERLFDCKRSPNSTYCEK